MLFQSKPDHRVKEIPIGEIVPNRAQPRTEFCAQELEELAASIRANGVLQPLTVRRCDGVFELVAGERRLRAAKLAGKHTVPCLVVQCDDRQSAVYALLENLQRVDLGPFEEAEGIFQLIEVWGVTQEEAARRLGKRQSTIANKLRLLRLTQEERKMIVENGLTERHARALLRLHGLDQRRAALMTIVKKGLNVQQTEALIEDVLREGGAGEKKKAHRTVVIKDVRLFLNTLNRAVDTMRLSGIPAVAAQHETEEYIECVVRIPKAAAAVRRPA